MQYSPYPGATNYGQPQGQQAYNPQSLYPNQPVYPGALPPYQNQPPLYPGAPAYQVPPPAYQGQQSSYQNTPPAYPGAPGYQPQYLPSQPQHVYQTPQPQYPVFPPVQQSVYPQYPNSNQYPQNYSPYPTYQQPPPMNYAPMASYEMFPGQSTSAFVFDPRNFSEQYNPWNASMWMQPIQPSYQTPSPIQSQQVQQPQKVQKVQVQTTNPTKAEISINQKRRKSEIFGFESVEQFQKMRQHATVESALQQLNQLGTDLSKISPSSFKPNGSSCFILCNSYTKPQYKLGVGPINDAVTTAANHKAMGYTVYFLHDPRKELFLSFLKIFFQKVDRYLTVYYAGHGSQVRDQSGDEKDGYDEVMVFDEGYIVDDQLLEYIKNYSTGKAYTILISDCCHSGSIWDIPTEQSKLKKLPPNIMSIAAADDSQTAKQSSNQGIFTYNFWSLIRSQPKLTPKDAQRYLNKTLKQFNQELIIYPTRKEMMDKPIFPLLSKKY